MLYKVPVITSMQKQTSPQLVLLRIFIVFFYISCFTVYIQYEYTTAPQFQIIHFSQLQYTKYNIQYTIYNIQYTIYYIQYTIYNIQGARSIDTRF